MHFSQIVIVRGTIFKEIIVAKKSKYLQTHSRTKNIINAKKVHVSTCTVSDVTESSYISAPKPAELN